MQRALQKYVFHETKVANVAFRAMVQRERVVLHMESESGRESSVNLIGDGFALPSLCYSAKGWQRRGMLSGPRKGRTSVTWPDFESSFRAFNSTELRPLFDPFAEGPRKETLGRLKADAEAKKAGSGRKAA